MHVLTWRLFDYDGDDLTYGGQQRWLLELARLLNELGRAVVVHQRSHHAFERRLGEGIAVRGHPLPTRAIGSPAFNLAVHRQVPRGAPVVYMVEDLAFPRCRPQSVVVQHGIWWDGEYGWAKVRIAERVARWAVRRAGAVVCVDTNFINWYRARWPEADDGRRLHYVPNFIDAQAWGPQPIEPAARLRPGDPVTICFPRRSEPRRGIWLMADVAPRLSARFPQVRFRFAVGSGYCTAALRERLLGCGMAPDRWRIDSLPFARMRELYERSAIAVLPTLCGEGTSLAAIEAMYFGCAVVATWVGGLPNLVHDGHNGLLVAPAAADVEGALARLVRDQDLRVHLGRNAMAMVPELYGVSRWRARLAPVLARALRIDAG